MYCAQKEKEAGNEAFKAGQWQEALRLYTLALERDPKNKDMNSKLYNNRATVLQKVGGSALLSRMSVAVTSRLHHNTDV